MKMVKYKIIYIDTQPSDISLEKEVLLKIDAELVKPKSCSEEDLIECGKDCDGIIVDLVPITSSLLENCPKLKVISRLGIGYNNVDIEAASKKGVMVANVPDYCLGEVADHTLALALTCIRKTAAFNDAVRYKDVWAEKSVGPMYRLRDQIFALYGFGNIAKNVAKRAEAFGFKIAAFDPYLQDSDFEEYSARKVNSLEELASIADIFSIHAPATKETEGTVDISIFKKMKPTCTVINTSRGILINEEDMVTALKEKMFSAAGIDVFTEEPLPVGSKLFDFDNVIITPHVAFYTEESNMEMRQRAAGEIVNTFTDGHPRLTAFVNKKDFGY